MTDYQPEFRAMRRREKSGSRLVFPYGFVLLINIGMFFLAGDEPNIFGAILIVLVSPIANLLMCILGLATLGGWGAGPSSRFWRFEPLLFILVCLASAIALFAATRLRYS